MIGKVCPRGESVAGLLRYLYATGPAQQEGRGRRNPHVNPRLVGGFDDPGELEPAVSGSGRRDFRRYPAKCGELHLERELAPARWPSANPALIDGSGDNPVYDLNRRAVRAGARPVLPPCARDRPFGTYRASHL